MRCAVFGCSSTNKHKNEISFHSFPKSDILLQTWIKFCRQKDQINTNTAAVCSNHFSSNDFENNMRFEMGFTKIRILKLGAYPTIYVRNDGSDGSTNKLIQKLEFRAHKEMKYSILHSRSSENSLYEENASAALEPTEEIYIEEDIESNINEYPEEIYADEDSDTEVDTKTKAEHKPDSDSEDYVERNQLEETEAVRVPTVEQYSAIDFTSNQFCSKEKTPISSELLNHINALNYKIEQLQRENLILKDRQKDFVHANIKLKDKIQKIEQDRNELKNAIKTNAFKTRRTRNYATKQNCVDTITKKSVLLYSANNNAFKLTKQK